jgi:hypothetical protein
MTPITRRATSYAASCSSDAMTTAESTESRLEQRPLQRKKQEAAMRVENRSDRSQERDRSLKSTLKLRQVLGEPLDEELIRHWVILPQKLSRASRLATCHGTQSTNPQNNKLAGNETGPLPVAPDGDQRKVNIRRNAKLFSILGERLDASTWLVPTGTAPMNSIDAPKSDDRMAGLGITQRREAELVQKFIRAGLIL